VGRTAIIEYTKAERIYSIVNNVSTGRRRIGAPGRMKGVKIATENRITGNQAKQRLPNDNRYVGTTRDVAGPYL